MEPPLVIHPDNDVLLCHEDDAPYMLEYLHYIAGACPIVLYNSRQDAFTDRTKRYVCVRRVPFEKIPPETDTPVVFVNTEQLSVPWKMVEFRAHAVSPRVGLIYDYSDENVKLSNGRSVHFPIRESVAETTALKTYMRQEGMDRNKIACVGSVTSYRVAIINGLRNRGLQVDFIQEFGEKRDRRVAACSLLLNLHAGKVYNLYETLRCERWRFAGMPILSEPCTDAVPTGVSVFPVTDLDLLVAELKAALQRTPTTAP